MSSIKNIIISLIDLYVPAKANAEISRSISDIKKSTNSAETSRPVIDSLDSVLADAPAKSSNPDRAGWKKYISSTIQSIGNAKNSVVEYFRNTVVSGYKAIKRKAKKAYSRIKLMPKTEKDIENNELLKIKEFFLRFYLMCPLKGHPEKSMYVRL
jgi:hypothetical protein